MNNLSRMLEESMSLHHLEEQAKEFDNQIAVMNKKKEGLLREINARRPTLMDKARSKRKASELEKQEIEDFSALLGSEELKEEDNYNNDVDDLPKTRKRYKDEVKEKAVELIKKHGVSFVAEKSKIHESNLKRWMKDDEAEESKTAKSKKGRRIRFPEFENELLKFIAEKKNDEKPVTSRVIFVKARSIKKPLKISDS